MQVEEHQCEVCGHQAVEHVVALPGIPMSIGKCGLCTAAGAVPYWALLFVAVSIGGLEHAHPAWLGYAERVLVFLGKNMDAFAADVSVEVAAAALTPTQT